MVSDVVLGEGEFGIVNKGSYRGQDGRIYDVAVKQLKGTIINEWKAPNLVDMFFFSSFISPTFKGMSRPAATKPVLQKKCTQCTSIYFSCIYFFVSRLLILFKCPLLSPDGTSMADKNDLLSEIKVLKKAGRHPNIVSLVGVCTREGMFFPNLYLLQWILGSFFFNLFLFYLLLLFQRRFLFWLNWFRMVV